jgi:hypothetical protein
VPLAELVIEGFGGGSLDQLAKILNDMVVLDDLGRRCCTRETARALFTARVEKRAADAERQLAEREKSNPTRDRVRAIQRQQSHIEATGNALADIKTADTHKNWDRAAAIRNEMQSGAIVYRRVQDEEQTDV